MTDPLIGRELGNYQIIDTLGQGGMARVYKARDMALNRLAAIKVIEPDLSDIGTYAKRFRKEAQAIAALEHPHIVPVYYFGKQDDVYFMALKFVEGQDLSVLMARYAKQGEYLPLDDTLRIVETIGSALDYAHSKNVIHRDIKPANIMIDKQGHSYLTDFGLALDVNQGTMGEIFGTPHYIAPEQARNSAEAVPQSDLYALGVMIYELFAGTVPFNDPTPTAVALQHIMNEPPAPRYLNPEIAPQIEAVILKALAKKPEDRYQSGRELSHALQEAVQSAAFNDSTQELPPLPPGIAPPVMRKPSSTPIATQVRASLLESTPLKPAIARYANAQVQSPRKNQPVRTKPAKASTSHRRKYWLMAAIIVAILVGVAFVLTTGNTNIIPDAAVLPAVQPSETAIQQAVVEATLPPSPASAITVPSTTPSPTDVLPTATPTDTLTPVPPTATLIPTLTNTATFEPIITGATAAPEDWLPISFIYNQDAFYWLNYSGQSISSQYIGFQQVNGLKSFAGNRWAYWTMEPGRCMEIVFIDVSVPPRPQGCRPNAFFTPARNQDIDFWTSGQFAVFWHSEVIAVCDSAAGQCNAFVPPA